MPQITDLSLHLSLIAPPQQVIRVNAFFNTRTIQQVYVSCIMWQGSDIGSCGNGGSRSESNVARATVVTVTVAEEVFEVEMSKS